MGLVVLAGGGVSADEQVVSGNAVVNGSEVPALVVSAVAPAATGEVKALLLTAVPVSDAALGAESGKAQLQLDKVTINDQDLNGVSEDNIATGNTNGNNTISGDAFSNSAGFVTAIQNTGNNVLIQDATIINISMAP